jgi:hypothetical protein
MRKTIVGDRPETIDKRDGWMNLEDLVTVEVTSETPEFPIEGAVTSNGQAGWRAAGPGVQIIRLLFDNPVSLQHIQLRFEEPDRERTQEFTLRWSSAREGGTRDIVRQQWNFNPAGSTVEVEEYAVNLKEVSVVELEIEPDVGHGIAPATLTSWRLR